MKPQLQKPLKGTENIFEFNGELYKKAPGDWCFNCDFAGIGCIALQAQGKIPQCCSRDCKAVIFRKIAKQYAWSFNGDEYYQYTEGNNLQECLEEALESFSDFPQKDAEGEFIYLWAGEVENYKDDIDADTIISMMQEKLDSDVGPEIDSDSTGYLCNVDTTWLQEQLSKVWKEFKIREKISAPCFSVNNAHCYRVNIKLDKNDQYELVSYRLDDNTEEDR